MSEGPLVLPGARPCDVCHTELSATALACPACGTLVHAARLKALAAEAERAAATGDPSAALAAWRSAHALLPRDSRQAASIAARIDTLSRQVPQSVLQEQRAAAEKRGLPSWAKRAGPIGAIGLLVWKLKFVIALVLSQGKLLLVGLTKGATFWSMLLALGVYWSVFGWKFALGFLLSIYVHEMGHVAALRRYGIAATAPMFIPGLGALVRLRQYPANPVEDARVGLAGPVWGLGAAVACYLVYQLTGAPLWAALARSGAFINLFNLLPVWQLDGSRGFAALARGQRWWITAVLVGAWAWSSEGLLVLLALVAAVRALGRDAPAKPDQRTLIEFVALVVALTALARIHVPGAS